MIFHQREIPGGHELRGEADLADGHALIILIFTHVTDDPLGTVTGSEITGAEVWLNGSRVRDPEFGNRLYQEARGES